MQRSRELLRGEFVPTYGEFPLPTDMQPAGTHIHFPTNIDHAVALEQVWIEQGSVTLFTQPVPERPYAERVYFRRATDKQTHRKLLQIDHRVNGQFQAGTVLWQGRNYRINFDKLDWAYVVFDDFPLISIFQRTVPIDLRLSSAGRIRTQLRLPEERIEIQFSNQSWKGLYGIVPYSKVYIPSSEETVSVRKGEAWSWWVNNVSIFSVQRLQKG